MQTPESVTNQYFVQHIQCLNRAFISIVIARSVPICSGRRVQCHLSLTSESTILDTCSVCEYRSLASGRYDGMEKRYDGEATEVCTSK